MLAISLVNLIQNNQYIIETHLGQPTMGPDIEEMHKALTLNTIFSKTKEVDCISGLGLKEEEGN